MANPQEGPSPREGPTTTPSRYPEITPPQTYPSGEFSYILEIVMGTQATLGRLTEAVESLKEQSREHDKKLDQVRMDVHAGKTTVKVVGTILAVAITFAGWVINKGIDAYTQARTQTPTAVQSAPTPAAK